VRNPLRWFGTAEALVGVTAAASPLALAGLQRAYVAVYPYLPHTLAALARGEISEWRATLVARETAVLSKVDRLTVDRELAGKLATAGDRQVADQARAIGYRLRAALPVRLPSSSRMSASGSSWVGRRHW